MLGILPGCLSYGWRSSAVESPGAKAPLLTLEMIGVGAQHLIDIGALTESFALELRQCGARVQVTQEHADGQYMVRCKARDLSTTTATNLVRARATLQCDVTRAQDVPRSLSAEGSQTITLAHKASTRLELEQATLTQALLDAQRNLACPLVDLLHVEPNVQTK